MKSSLAIVGLVLLLVALIGVGPVLTILSLNALFGLGIGITIWNWLSVVWLSTIAVGIASAGNKSKE